MKKLFLFTCLSIGIGPHAVAQTAPVNPATCEKSSTTVPVGTGKDKDALVLANTAEHSNGAHSVFLGKLPPGAATAPSGIKAACIYTHAAARQTYCNVQCSVYNDNGDTLNPLSGITPQESGTHSGILPVNHVIGFDFKPGAKPATNAGAACSGSFGAAVASCTILNLNCTMNISVGDALGGKPTVNIQPGSSSTLWADSISIANDCGAILDPQYSGGGGGGLGCTPNPNNSTIPVVKGPAGAIRVKILDPGPEVPPPCDISPIIIDTEGEGFQLTSFQGGVKFDIRGDGHPIQLSWTAAGSHNAFLALDRDGSGTITSGKELFGDWTDQPRSPNPNGFLALAEFDKPEKGGNGDGAIAEHDAVWPQLRLWIDENHDGVAQRNEIHALYELGVFSLALNYRESQREDRYGNQFRYKAKVNPGHHDRRDDSEVGRNAYDVFFVTK